MTSDDFNWKFPNRSDTMYLSKCSQIRKSLKACRDSLKTDDIEGARPRYLLRQFLNKPSFINRNDDIERSCPKIHVVSPSRPDNQLFTADIDGAAPKYNKFTTTRQTNPLNPVYQLPVTKLVEPEVPKFIRDSINVDDIEGTKTKETFAMRLTRQGKFIPKEDIQTKVPHRTLVKTQNYMNVADINDTGKFQSRRVTDPQDPVYEVMDEDNKKVQIGEIQKSKTKQQPNYSRPDFSHRTGDIQGSWAGSLLNKFVAPPNQHLPQNRITNYIADIKGTQVNSRKVGLSSKRVVNPLQPQYQFPGHSEPPVVKPTMHSRPKSAAQKLDSFIR